MSLLGAIAGDIIGSRFEWNRIKHKDFELFAPECRATDDSIMTLAIGKAILECGDDWEMLYYEAERCMHEVGKPYPYCGYGGGFFGWMYGKNPAPYNSFGNGAAMRVSAVAHAASSLQEACEMSWEVTRVTHDHLEGIKGAEATTTAVYLARTGVDKEEIRRVIHETYYPMDFTLDGIRPTYHFNETCQGTVPQALMAFFESTGYEDAIRNAVSLGGDSDTLAAITGGVAGAYYGVPDSIRERALAYLDERLRAIFYAFEVKYPYAR